MRQDRFSRFVAQQTPPRTNYCARCIRPGHLSYECRINLNKVPKGNFNKMARGNFNKIPRANFNKMPRVNFNKMPRANFTRHLGP